MIVCNESNNSEMFICSAYPVQVSGHQLVSVPVSSTSAMYQTVMANIHSAESNQVQVWSLLCFNFVFMGVFPESALLGITFPPLLFIDVKNKGRNSFSFVCCLLQAM